MTSTSRFFPYFCIFGYLLNLGWEYAHMPLYSGGLAHTIPLGFPLASIASVGDVGMFIILYVIIRWIQKSNNWASTIFAPYILLSLCGAILAIAVEEVALHLHTWQYSSLMPLLPGLRVGISPLLQMSITPLLAWGAAHFLDAHRQ